MHDLARDQLPHAVRAWAAFVGCGEPLSESAPSSLRWLLARWEAGDEHVPLGLLHDLGHLLLRGRDFRFASARDLAHWPADERASRLAYEDRVLGRWAVDPSVADAHVAIAGMPVALRERAVAHAVGIALVEPLRAIPSLVLGNAADLRSTLPALVASLAEVPCEPAWRTWARLQLGDCAAAVTDGRLFRAEDLWEIAHLTELPSESARLALREVHAAASRAGVASASTALRLRRKAHEVPVDHDDTDVYPAGGFDAIGTRGTFENLVRTEVAYVGEGRDDATGIDLFDVRFVERELLYYTRDESPLLDARREVTLVLDRPAEQRDKRPALSAQTLVLAQGVVLAVQADLVRVFGPSGSRVRIVWRAPTRADRAAADEERALVGVTLASEVAHRRVELAIADAWDEVPSASRVVLSPRTTDDDVACAAWVRVGEDAWSIGDARFDLARDEGGLRAVADAVLEAVAGKATSRREEPARKKA